MNDEKEVLNLADDYKEFTKGSARIIYIKNDNQKPYSHMFGFWDFSSVESENLAVFDMLHQYLKKVGADAVVGPINYCTWLTHRIALDNFDSFFYPDRQGSNNQNEFLKKLGYDILQVSASTMIDVDEKVLPKKINMPNGFNTKCFCGEDVKEILPNIYQLSVAIFKDFPLYSFLSYDDYLKFYINNLKQITPDVALFFDNNKPIGYAFGYVNPDNKCYIGKTMGVLKEYRSTRMIFKIVEEYINLVTKYNMDKFVFHYRPIEKPILENSVFGNVSLKKQYGLYIKKDI